ncbi:MAG: FAD-binding oxidoreductase [Acidimicrobiia bacterium]|nr:FAD-binding oxidoreductase [Acidimicrobiia bacterium]
MTALMDSLADLVGTSHVLTGDAIGEDYAHDEALTASPQAPAAVVRPATTDEVASVLRAADEAGTPVTARGAGTGLCGASIPRPDAIMISFERMNEILEIDTDNQVAVVQPGVTLEQLDDALAPLGYVYPVYPGENSATIGGNVATNAGGMRAVKYGVTRHRVLGLEAVLPTGEVMRTGGKFVKATTGYDLTQLIIGSEGTLALVTEATLKIERRPEHSATVLAPFATLAEITGAIPEIIRRGVDPTILEYIDLLGMEATTESEDLDLGIPQEIRETALAYLVVLLEGKDADRVEEDVETLGELLTELGALDLYVLPEQAATRLLVARERAFWVSKARGADDIIDVVVPRASIPDYLQTVSDLAQENGAFTAGAGHAGDGNVHLAVFQPDAEKRRALMHGILEAGMALGGAISAEHGIGSEKQAYFLELEDPVKIDLMRRIKTAFDPRGILNPGTLLDS